VKTRLALGLVVAAALGSLGLAQDAAPAKKAVHDEVVLEQPFDEVAGRVPDALKKGGFVVVSDVDWTKLAGPDGKPLEAGTRRVRTLQFATPGLAKAVLSTPKIAFFAPAQVAVLEESGKTKLAFIRPLLEAAKEPGDATKVDAHASRAQFEADVDSIVASLKAAR
jgi:uncharacterized protein (DUF302 family)